MSPFWARVRASGLRQTRLLLIGLVFGCGRDSAPTSPKSKPVARVVLTAFGVTTVDPFGTVMVGAAAYDADGISTSTYGLTFQSSVPTIATISSSGVVTAKIGPGNTSITASVGSVTSNPVTVTVRDVSGIPTTITKVKDAPGTMTVGTSDSVKAKVSDLYGKPVVGAAVTFTTNGWCTITPTTTATDSNGVVTVPFGVPTRFPASCSMSAAVAKLTPITFSTTAIAGPPVRMHVPALQFAAVGWSASFTPDFFDMYGNQTTGVVTYTSRDPQVATITTPPPNQSTIVPTVQGIASGHTYFVVSTGALRDSTYVTVGPVAGMFAAVMTPSITLKADTVFTAPLIIQSFGYGSILGSATVRVRWDPTLLTLVSDSASFVSSGVAINTNNAAAGVVTVAYASNQIAIGGYFLRNLTFRVSSVTGQSGKIDVIVDQMADNQFNNLLGVSQGISVPVRIQ